MRGKSKFVRRIFSLIYLFVCFWSAEVAILLHSILLQYNLNGSNMDGLFTVDDSNSFSSPYKILPIAQENKYLEIFSYFIMELYVVYSH